MDVVRVNARKPLSQSTGLGFVAVAGLRPVITLPESRQIRRQKMPASWQSLQPQPPVFLHGGKAMNQDDRRAADTWRSPFQENHLVAIDHGFMAAGLEK